MQVAIFGVLVYIAAALTPDTPPQPKEIHLTHEQMRAGYESVTKVDHERIERILAQRRCHISH